MINVNVSANQNLNLAYTAKPPEYNTPSYLPSEKSTSTTPLPQYSAEKLSEKFKLFVYLY